MNTLNRAEQTAVISALIEGNSIRSIERMTHIHRDTIMRLTLKVGAGCARLLDSKLRNIKANRIQVDEIWTYVFKKQARLMSDSRVMGDQYVFIGMDADTKLVISHLVGKRNHETTYYFCRDLSQRLTARPQITTDGFAPYIRAIEDNFGADVDYAQLVKLYGAPSTQGRDWYRPVTVIAAVPREITGNPDPRHISTSYIERQNLTMRMQMRRFTRLTNAFSKKLENLKAAISLHFAHYNFVRVHQTLRCTPAMEGGITNHIWSLDELLTSAIA